MLFIDKLSHSEVDFWLLEVGISEVVFFLFKIVENKTESNIYCN